MSKGTKKGSFMKKIVTLSTVLLSLSLVMFSPLSMADQADDIIIENTWVGAPPPGALALGAFAVLKNPTDQAIVLQQAKATGFDSVQLHETINQNNMHRMVEIQELRIPAKSQVALKHGSYHIMLMGVHHEPKPGDHIPITLVFSDHSHKTVEFKVSKGMHH